MPCLFFYWKTLCDAVLHRVADALTFEDETKGWCHLQRQLTEFLWEDLARTSRIKVPFLSLPTAPEIKIIIISPKQEAHHLIWEKKMHFPMTLTQSYRSGSKNELLKITSKLSLTAPLHRHLSTGKNSSISSSELLIHSNKRTTAK